MIKLQQDNYRKSRGGSSRFLAISCAWNKHHIFYYQKDGPGMLKRLYLDRIVPRAPKAKTLICVACKETLGILTIYKKENRPAYRLFAGAVSKKIVSSETINHV